MTLLSTLIVIVIVMALVFDFVNGWNDSANALATVVATRVMSPTVAVMMATVLNLAGAMVGNEVANTMSKIIHTGPGFASQEGVLIIVILGLFSAAIWAAVMTIYGMPISGSHSLIGGIVGAGVAAAGTKILIGSNIKLTPLAMLFAPALGRAASVVARRNSGRVGVIRLRRSEADNRLAEPHQKEQRAHDEHAEERNQEHDDQRTLQ